MSCGVSVGSRRSGTNLGAAMARTTSVDFASAKTEPSRPTSVTRMSAVPVTPAGRRILRLGSAFSAMAQVPGAIECPSDREAIAGSPRTLTKLSRGTDAAGPMRMGKGACVAGSAGTVAAMLMVGRSDVCALAVVTPANPSAARSRQSGIRRRWSLALGGAASFTGSLPHQNQFRSSQRAGAPQRETYSAFAAPCVRSCRL